MKKTHLVLIFFFSAFFSTCTQSIEPEDGFINYAVLHTSTDYAGADSAHFETVPTIGGTPKEIQLPLQTQPGWQNSTEYYEPHCPDWTEDGKYAAYNDGRNITIYDSLENESELIELDFDAVWDVAWSPDQAKLAFSGDQEVGNTVIWLADLVSKEIEPIIECKFCQSPAWRPDGQAIAYVNLSSYINRIEVYDLNSRKTIEDIVINTGQIILPTEGPVLAWSPDGKMIAFSAGNERKQSIFILSLETGDIEPIITDAEVADSPVWSPTGEQLLYRESEVLESPLPGEIRDRVITNLIITSDDGRGRYIVTENDNPSLIFYCPRWVVQK
jgi:Tol biopolymer transport system component